MSSSAPSTTIDRITKHILSHCPYPSRHPKPPPLFVAIQGPQGSGKTYITSLLTQHLPSPPHNLKLATLSIDDLYLPHRKLRELKEQLYPGNRLLEGRGLPGTHDLEFGIGVLGRLKNINQGSPEAPGVVLPVFDKSLHNGEGDRLPLNYHATQGPLDIVIVEGWCMGFSSISSSTLRARWEGMDPEMKQWCGLGHVREVNRLLEAYEGLWAFFDVFIQVLALFSFSNIHADRLTHPPMLLRLNHQTPPLVCLHMR
jgi:D-glycerate 3-kinase